jgi:hypothetical protein
MPKYSEKQFLAKASVHRHYPKLRSVSLLATILYVFSYFDVVAGARAQLTQALTQSPSEVNLRSGSGPGSTASEANNPVAPLNQLQIQNRYNSSDYGTTGQSNLFLIRPVLSPDRRGLDTRVARSSSAFPL